MFEAFFGLNRKAFQITADPNFLWMGKKHREALSTLKYGVMDNKGFLLLTGDVGTGKTTLINRLVEDIKNKAYTAKIPDPRLSKYDFFRMVSRYFGLPIEIRTKSDFIDPFSRFLNDAHEERKSVLLLIDEAQRLKHDLMEEIRLLSNLERQDAKLLNIFFVGQNEFNSILLQPENRALMRRITITHNLDPLDQDETGDYIRHRLKVAGAGYDIFSVDAIEEAYDFSNGFPRQINIICDLAMFFSAQLKERTVSGKVVRQCRERISFSIEEPSESSPDEQRKTAESPQPTATLARPSRVTPVRAVMAALLILAGGVYLAPDALKSQARQWMNRFVRGSERPPATSTEKQRSDGDTTGSDHAAVGTDVPPAITHDGPPLRMPRRPPELNLP